MAGTLKKNQYPIEELIAQGCITREQVDYIINRIKNRKSVIIQGAIRCGKTTLLRAILEELKEPITVLVDDKDELSYIEGLGSSVRKASINSIETWDKSSILVIGEISRPEVINSAIYAIRSGYCVVGTGYGSLVSEPIGQDVLGVLDVTMGMRDKRGYVSGMKLA